MKEHMRDPSEPRQRVAAMEKTEHNQQRKFVIAGAAPVILALLVTACGASVSPAGESTDTIAGNVPADIDIIVYQGADVLGGEEVALSAVLAQGKPVVVNMWAGLCPVCRIEMPHLEEVHQEFQDQVVIFGLDVGPFVGLGDEEDALALMKQMKVTYPTGTTTNAQVVKDYQVLGTPSLYFITPDGEIVNKWAGVMTNDKLAESVEELLAASAN